MERRMCNLDLQGLTGATSRSPNTTMDQDMDVEIHKTHPKHCSSTALSLFTADCCRQLPTASP